MTIETPLIVAIADDNKDHAYSVATLIKAWGHDAHIFLDTDAVLSFCERQSPDVLLLDIGFPRRTDGLFSAAMARKLLAPKPVKIIAMTGFSDDETRAQGDKAGFDHYFVKPVDLEKLQALLTELHSKQAGD